MKVLITDNEFPQLDDEKRIFAAAGLDWEIGQCRTPEAVASRGADADALLVHWAPLSRQAIAGLRRCRVIVRYGIGVDNIDLAAATERGISVCNVPDYASGEVADHTLALALALGRQLAPLDQRLRSGQWKIVPDRPMPAFREMRFVTLGFGRIAREVVRRAQAFGFVTAAHDPFVAAATMAGAEVLPLSLAEAWTTADILSLHLPLTAETRRIVNADSLRQMKPAAILINTSRGSLIDTDALACALSAGALGGAGLDVFEKEPLPSDDPIRRAPRALLTSHVAWYSDSSLPRLQRMAAEEIVRGLRGEPLRSQINLHV